MILVKEDEKMKKLILFATMIMVLATGCGNMMNTPTKKVEEFLSKYQTMDKDVLEQLDDVIKDAGSLVEDQKNDYRELMKKQYQNLSYKINNSVLSYIGRNSLYFYILQEFTFSFATKILPFMSSTIIILRYISMVGVNIIGETMVYIILKCKDKVKLLEKVQK